MIALYPGTFDPLTKGHVDIAARGAKLFDKLILSVSENPKKKTAFPLEERVEMAKEALFEYKNIEVVPFTCLLVHFMKKMKADLVIRGLRAVGDFEFEFQLALMNRKMDPNFETVFLMPNKQYIFISSSMVREVAEHGGDVSPFVPDCINKRIIDLYGEPSSIC
ncbi:MAG: pantetheine-phosphate adenylyltransferase [Denitrovibrio sp.]|nr:MAG: pantetheine-phosphate adenylyltransferase [Denitrovibrio sp.]